MKSKTRVYRTDAEFQKDLYALLDKENGLNRLEIARALGVAKSPHLLARLSRLVACGELIAVRRWISASRERFEWAYFKPMSFDYDVFQALLRDGYPLEQAVYRGYRNLMPEYYIEANGGLLGAYGYEWTKSKCVRCGDTMLRITHGSDQWHECCNCGDVWNAGIGEIPF